MAKVSKRRRKLPDGSFRDAGWQVRYVDPDGRQRLRVFKKKGDAADFRTEVEHRTRTGTYIDPSAGRVTFQEFAESWRKVQPWRPNTSAQAESRLRLHVYPAIGGRPLQAIKPTELQALVRDRADHLAPATLEVTISYVQAVFLAAIADRLIRTSPADKLKVPDAERVPVVPLERHQWLAFQAALPDRLQVAALLGVGVGLRQGEAQGLTVDRINFLKREIVVDRQMLATGKFGPPKTKASRRTIPVSKSVLDALAAQIKSYPDKDTARGLVLTGADGGRVSRTTFNSAIAAAAKAVGLDDKQRFHALRHTYASMLIRGGCSVKVVQARMGHATAQETLDTYGHLWPDDDDRTRAAVEAGLAGFGSEISEVTAP